MHWAPRTSENKFYRKLRILILTVFGPAAVAGAVGSVVVVVVVVVAVVVVIVVVVVAVLCFDLTAVKHIARKQYGCRLLAWSR